MSTTPVSYGRKHVRLFVSNSAFLKCVVLEMIFSFDTTLLHKYRCWQVLTASL